MASSTDQSAAPSRFLILGTAGHIDHGKTALVNALTGTNTDRLPEEKRRGMTIELGFAELAVGDVHFGVVDVPGHERFVRTMVAGATGIDLALIVVAGDDSVMPQTVEHVEVLRLVGIEQAVVAVTKIDTVDATLLDVVEDDVRNLLHGTVFQCAPMVRVSSVTGEGLGALKKALLEVAGRVSQRRRSGSFRMAVDRVFTVQGRGTVVTGSVLQGLVRSGDTLEVHPGSKRCRVREVQSHGLRQDAIQLGRRAALNLIGLDRRDMDRGHELATPGFIAPSHRVDTSFEVLQSCKRSIKPFSRLRICMGTRDVLARVVMLDRAEIAPGGTSYVQLRSDSDFFAVHGQRFIAREENDARTIGGGVVLRPVALRWSADRESERQALDILNHGSPDQRITQVSIEVGFADVYDLHLVARTGIEPDALRAVRQKLMDTEQWIAIDGFDRRVAPACIETLFDRADHRLQRYHLAHPHEPGFHVDAFTGWLERKSAPGLGRPLLDLYAKSARAQVHGRYICAPAFAPRISAQDQRILDGMRAAIGESGFAPPSLDSLAGALDTDVKRLRRLAKIAVAYGELVEIDGAIYLSAENESQLRRIVADMIREGNAVTVAQVRERLDSSRKYTVPFMEYLDRIRFTVRQGDTRVLHDKAMT
ncbi:MAG: selenocysteine-specific translation elongation factor [Phycisphaerae bacterium]